MDTGPHLIVVLIVTEKELREQIAQEIEALLNPPPIDEVDHIIWQVILDCAAIARGKSD